MHAMACTIQQGPSGSEVWALSRRQYGVVSRAQLVALGFTRSAIAHRLSRGRLHRVRLGPRPLLAVYAVGSPDSSSHGRWMAAVLCCGKGAVLSHFSAAALLGLREREPAVTDVTIGRGADLRPSGVRVHRRAPLSDDDVGVFDGIPVTSPVRTLIDLAAKLGAPRVEAAVNAADKLDLVDPESLREALEHRPGVPGVRALRRVLDRRTFVLTDSELERRFARIARRAGLPTAETGVWLNGWKVDFFWRELGLVVETDGLRYHRTAAQQSRDLRRDHTHERAGLRTVRFSHAQVRHDPGVVIETLAEIARQLRARSL